jgi:hypothetical protein
MVRWYYCNNKSTSFPYKLDPNAQLKFIKKVKYKHDWKAIFIRASVVSIFTFLICLFYLSYFK